MYRECSDLEQFTAESGPLATEGTVRASVQVLGVFSVVSADGSVPRWTSRKARVLLKVLVASQGVAVPRERLMHVLWPDEEPARLTNRFAVALATVRRALDTARALPTDHHLELRDDAVWLDPANTRVDLNDFHALAASRNPADLWRAMELYRGDAFPEEADADWAVAVRAQGQVSFCQAATRLAVLESGRGHHEKVCGLLRRVIDVDPFHEAAHHGLIEALAALGAHGQARTVAADFERGLSELTGSRRSPGTGIESGTEGIAAACPPPPQSSR